MSMPSRISSVLKHPEGLSILLEPQDEREHQRPRTRPIDEQRLLVIVSPYTTTPQAGDHVLVTRNAVIITSAHGASLVYARQGYTRIIEPTMAYRLDAPIPAQWNAPITIGYPNAMSGSTEGTN